MEWVEDGQHPGGVDGGMEAGCTAQRRAYDSRESGLLNLSSEQRGKLDKKGKKR